MIRLLPMLLVVACAAPDPDDMFNVVDMSRVDGGPAANELLIEVADAAELELQVALPGLSDMALSDALLDAWNRGVNVEVVTDYDQREDGGIAALIDAGVPVTLANAGIEYFDFGSNQDVAWTSAETRMTHSFAVADLDIFAMANGGGDTQPGTRIVFHGASEELAEDLVSEHIQVFGGSDATSTTAFSALAKSVADVRWAYPTQSDEIFELWFNPQERLIKRIIDMVYRAKSTVRVLSEDFADEGLARALQHKAEDGFDVEVVVGSSFGTTALGVSSVLQNTTLDVPVLQHTLPDALPTMVFIDFDRAADGRHHMPMVMVLTHPILSASRLYGGVPVVTDQLVDGSLYVLSVHGEPTAPLQEMASVYAEARADSEELR